MTKKKTRKLQKNLYTPGEKNKLLDASLHPLYKRTELFRFIDGLAHAAIEKDTSRSLRKFLEYNLPAILKKAMEK